MASAFISSAHCCASSAAPPCGASFSSSTSSSSSVSSRSPPSSSSCCCCCSSSACLPLSSRRISVSRCSQSWWRLRCCHSTGNSATSASPPSSSSSSSSFSSCSLSLSWDSRRRSTALRAVARPFRRGDHLDERWSLRRRGHRGRKRPAAAAATATRSSSPSGSRSRPPRSLAEVDQAPTAWSDEDVDMAPAAIVASTSGSRLSPIDSALAKITRERKLLERRLLSQHQGEQLVGRTGYDDNGNGNSRPGVPTSSSPSLSSSSVGSRSRSRSTSVGETARMLMLRSPSAGNGAGAVVPSRGGRNPNGVLDGNTGRVNGSGVPIMTSTGVGNGRRGEREREREVVVDVGLASRTAADGRGARGSNGYANGNGGMIADVTAKSILEAEKMEENERGDADDDEERVMQTDESFRWANENYNQLLRSVDVWSFVLTLRAWIWFIDAKWTYAGGFTEAKQGQRRRSLASWVRETILQLGPTFIKLGQLSSSRSDLLPIEFVEELSKLQDRVPAFTASKAISIIERELGQPVDSVFPTFEQKPLAAASLGQVHRARLVSGEEVVVKVQRPGLKQLFDIDLEQILHLILAERPRKILRTGFFHADPHPGNLAVSDDGLLIYYDFGMMGDIRSVTKGKLLDMFYAVYEKDASKVMAALIDLGALVPTADNLTVRRSIQFFLDNLMNQRPDEEATIAAIGEDLFSIAVDQPFRFPATFTFVLRAFSTLEGIAECGELLQLRNGDNQDFVLRQLQKQALQAERAARRAGVMQTITLNTVVAATLLNIGATLLVNGLPEVANTSFAVAGVFSFFVYRGFRRIKKLDSFERRIK
ncbi:hypothetical protein CBR_g20993 [Chara braunii]|uniref:ABC1 atypical kinase-like domain-containing protein n=1 Tax=Chara braunii TaxID=69332 RepID=A0A388L0B1_CHABU|nr:hypothetical protein CBR_g20993 [Chara braunii]|eukprot:GBG75747.1 hypothetical protein CBR_g20993 [Chara braunii]